MSVTEGDVELGRVAYPRGSRETLVGVWLLLACALFGGNARAAEVELLRRRALPSGASRRRAGRWLPGARSGAFDPERQGRHRLRVRGIAAQAVCQFFTSSWCTWSRTTTARTTQLRSGAHTALGAYVNCDNIDRLLCIDDGKVYAAAAESVPEFNFTIVLVNDPKYGGSGGSVCVSSSNQQSFEVLAHELGHSLARRPTSTATRVTKAAATLSTTVPSERPGAHRAPQVKWRDWIDDGTPAYASDRSICRRERTVRRRAVHAPGRLPSSLELQDARPGRRILRGVHRAIRALYLER